MGKLSTLERPEDYTSTNDSSPKHGCTGITPFPVGFAPRGADETEPSLEASTTLAGCRIVPSVSQSRIPSRGMGENVFGNGRGSS